MSNRTLAAAVVGGVLVIAGSGFAAWMGVQLAQTPGEPTAVESSLERIESRLEEMERLEFVAQQDRRDLEQRLTRLESQGVDFADRLIELERRPAAPPTEETTAPVAPVEDDTSDDEGYDGPTTVEELEAHIAEKQAEFADSNLQVKSKQLELLFGMYADTSPKGERNRSTQGRMEGRQLAGELGLIGEEAQQVIDAVEEHHVSLGPVIGPYVAEGRESVDGELVAEKFQELDAKLDEKLLALFDEKQQEIYRLAVESRRRLRDQVLELWDDERLNR